MAVLSKQQLYTYAQQAGFTGAALDEVVAIALAESGGDTQHVHINPASTTKIGSTTTQVPAGTRDRGVLQINDWWNSGQPGRGALVTDAQAFDPAYSFKWAYKVTGGKQPTATSDPFKAYWVTVQTGAYKKFLTSGGAGTTSSGSGSASGGSGSTSSGSASGGSASGGSGTTTSTTSSGGGIIGGVQPGSYALTGHPAIAQTTIPSSAGSGSASSGSGLYMLVAIVAILSLATWLFLRRKKQPELGAEPEQQEPKVQES